MHNRIPLILRPEDWPAADQELWNALLANGDFLEDSGAAAKWSQGTRRIHAQGYGQWLSYLSRTSPSILQELPIERVTKERVRSYLEELRMRLKVRSQLNLLLSLYIVMRSSDPQGDWGWLSLAVRRLGYRAQSASVPAPKPITAGQIFHKCLKRLLELSVNGSSDVPPLHQSIHFRQFLMMAFLIARPVRNRALLAMDVDRHLECVGDRFLLHFSSCDMKDRRDRTFPLPQALQTFMREYLDVHRRVLLGGNRSPALWINRFGKAITAHGLARELARITKLHLGVEMRTHSFRHVASTSIAEFDPEHVGIIKDLLGHATLDMAEKHYNRATGISSCNALQSIVEDIRTNVPRMGRAKRGDGNPVMR